jgi:PAS domain S-box-containing protein
MQRFLQAFFVSNPFIPHGHCYLWKPGLVGLHLMSDVLIAIAYFSIPLTLIYFIRKRQDIPFNKIFLLFSAFIVACGTTHLMEVWTLWHPTYWLSGLIKAITAIVSLYTAVILVSLLPKALELPSLAATNQALETEIVERQKSEAKSRAILATIPDLMFQTNAEGVYLEYVTPHRTSDLLPQTFDPIGRWMSELLPPDIGQRHIEHIQRAIATNQLQTYEQQIQIGDRFQDEEVKVMRCGDDKVLFMFRDISARKQAEEERQRVQRLRLELHLLENILEVSFAGYFDWDIPGNREYLSSTFKRMLGYDDELPNTLQTWKSLIFPEDLPRVLESFDQHVTSRGQIPYYNEVRYRHKNGSNIWVICSGRVIEWDRDGNPLRMIGCYIDITERKQIEQALKSSEARYRAILEDQTELIVRFLPDTTIVFVNEAYCRYFGLQREELIGKSYTPAIFEDDQETVAQEIQSMSAENPTVTIENRVVINGEIRWTQWITRMLFDELGQFVELQSVGRDITELKKTEEALRISEEQLGNLSARLTLAIKSGAIGIWECHVGCNVPIWDDRMYELYGLQPSDFSGTLDEAWRKAVHPDDLAPVRAAVRLALQGKKEFDQEFRVVHPDGTIRFLEAHALVQCNEQGEPQCMVGINYDITDRKQAEQTLQELHTAMQNAVEGISRLDINGYYVSMNQAYANLCGYEPEELIGQLWQQTVYSDDLPDMIAVYQQMLETGKVEAETRGVRKDGSIFYKQVTMITAYDQQGNVTGNHCFMKDISDRKYAEAQLRHTNAQLAHATRLKDEFLANMSHELRTPLNSILGMSESFQEGVFGSINDRQAKAIATIERSGKHLLELINDILDLSKIASGKMELEISNAPVISLCESSLAFIRQMALKKNIRLNTRIPKTLGSIQVDERRLRQVLINLLSNAVKFTLEGGTVTLEVRLEQAGEAEEATSPLSPPSPSSPSSSPHLCFSIIDTGIGIAPEDIGKLFQPFLQLDSRLNRQYTGTGLGLALVQKIMALHGGTVSVSSAVGQGSCFTVRLPYRTSDSTPATPITASCPSPKLPSDNVQVLIIEDSIPAADQISRYLSALGMQSIVYPRGEGAVEEVKRVQPAVIILDLLLPNISGWDVLTQLKTNPQTQKIPVIIISVMDERSKGLSQGAFEHLVKPITRAQFQATLEKLQHPAPAGSPSLIGVSTPAREKPLILLAEDNQANIDTMSDYLENRGYRLLLAKNGQEAINLAKSQRPDLILMDIQMPGMDGLEAIRRLRDEEQLTRLPIIALTALAMQDDREKCLNAGANEYLTKPVKLKQLTAMIQQLLKGNI